MEGVHLRFGKVARGGLRWSDRAQDYRTEVLGLVKAQQVKNAVIVPVGAKGGFYPKQLPVGGSRDEIFKAGTEAYKTYIRTLLSVTDNIVGQEVVPPEDTLRLDGDDPYFVVAADKGTATFSDTANALAQEADFWLDDASLQAAPPATTTRRWGLPHAARGRPSSGTSAKWTSTSRRRPSPSPASATCRATSSATACCFRKRSG